MCIFTFKKIPVCYQDASRINDDGVDFYLERDDWNDFGYYTTYHLHAGKKLTGNNTEYIGPICIMQKGQKEGEQNLIPEQFEKLGLNFCSISTSVDFFKKLSEIIPFEKRTDFIDSIRLILGEKTEWYNEFKDESCFQISLLRGTSIDDDSLKLGTHYLLNMESFFNIQTQEIKIKLYGVENSISLNFSKANLTAKGRTPGGTCIFIGKNGTGKSTALYQIAKLLYAAPREREKLKEKTGEIVPGKVGFNRLIMVSFSPFDNFLLPGISVEDYKSIINGMKKGNGRFIFCGIRDVEKEFQERITELCDNDEAYDEIRQNKIVLKDIGSLSSEFCEAVCKICDNKNLRPIWGETIDRFIENQYFQKEDIQHFKKCLSCNVEIVFSNLSTGCKFCLHVLSHIILYCENNSLVIFDEPENHLHPPLLAFLICEIKRILNIKKSIMLIATHSPVVLQESFSSNVYVFRRHGTKCTVANPSIETYGENIGTITSEVFDLTVNNTGYHQAFDALYDSLGCDSLSGSREVINKFEEKLESPLSNQMCAYLINKKRPCNNGYVDIK